MKLFRYTDRQTVTLCFLLLSGLLSFSGCKKLISINPPLNSTGDETTFKNDVNATMALTSVYSSLMTTDNLTLTNGGMTVYSGIIADELVPMDVTPLTPTYEFYTGHIRVDNGFTSSMWDFAYKSIFFANSVMEGAAASQSVGFTEKTRALVAGETRAARAFCYYYLVNMFGPVPMPLTADVSQVKRIPRSSVEEVTQQMIKDLSEATDLLPDNYDASRGEKTRINKYAAAALLARAYLFDKKYEAAITAADQVINSGKYALEPLNKVFQPNSSEAIWQLKLNTTGALKEPMEAEYLVGGMRTKYMPEGFLEMLIEALPPEDFDNAAALMFYPLYRMSYDQVDAFEPNDQRKVQWLDSLATRPDGFSNGRKLYLSERKQKRNWAILQVLQQTWMLSGRERGSKTLLPALKKPCWKLSCTNARQNFSAKEVIALWI